MSHSEWPILRIQKTAPFESTAYGEQRTYDVSDVNCVTHARITDTRWTHLLSVLLALLFAGVASAQTEQPLRIPFRTEKNMILVDVTVNGAKAVLLLDTGAKTTALNPEFVGVGKSDAVRAIHQGVYLHRTVNLQIAKHYWSNWQVLVIDIAEKSLTRVDGLLGEDWLRTFSSFRIDYKNSYIELEEKQ